MYLKKIFYYFFWQSVTIGCYINIVVGYCRVFKKRKNDVIIRCMRQQLSPAARRAKAARDKAYAMTDDRKAKKNHSQKKRNEAKKKGQCVKGMDYDHKRQEFVSIASNRGNEGQGTQKESGANYSTDT